MPRAIPIIYAGIPSHSNAPVIKVPKLHKHNHQVHMLLDSEHSE